ncbi:MAG: tetratricopeptide repeat protein, partial [Sphingomonas bacterium]|nr:tetratricopeptide repeat protein [Sphingomonas bacterium]
MVDLRPTTSAPSRSTPRRRHGPLGLAIAMLLGLSPGVASGRVTPRAPASGPVTPAIPASFDTLIARAKTMVMADPEATLRIATEAGQIAASLPPSRDRETAVATAQWLRGEALMRLNRPEEADTLLREALRQAKSAWPGSKLNGDLLRSFGNVSAMRGRIQQALESFHAAYRIFQAIGDNRGQAIALMDIASIYNDAGDHERVLQYQAQAAEAYSGDPSLKVATHNNRGNALRELGRYKQAEAEYRIALQAARGLDSPLLEARVLTNLASAMALDGRIAEADAVANRGLKAASDDTAAGWRPMLWAVKAQVAFKRGDVPTAAKLIGRTFQGLDLAHTNMLFRPFHEVAHAVYKKSGDDKLALAHMEAFKRLDDESRALAGSTNAALMAARFDFANQDLRIAKLKTGQLQRDVLLERSRAQLRTTVTLGLASAVMVIFALLSFGYIKIRRSRNEVRAANLDLSGANRALEKALKAKTDFLATTSHEIRTPLNGILGMTQVILHDPTITGAMRERLQVVHGAGETMKALVDDILDVAKMETGHLVIDRAEFDLKQVLHDSARLWTGPARAKGVEFELDVEDCPARIVEDETRLRQILFNLMSNAVKFTDRGSIRLAASVAPAADEQAERLILSITDSGIGIPQEQLRRIFESFHQVDAGTTRRFGGTGLGLSICQKLAQAMGGTVSVESRPGAGSTFTVSLPLIRAAALKAAPLRLPRSSASGPHPLAACRLLLIERNPLAQSIIRAAIEPAVAEMKVVENGDQALEAICRETFEIIVIEGASGIVAGLDPFESVRAIVTAAPHAAVTALWASLSDDDRAALTASGA